MRELFTSKSVGCKNDKDLQSTHQLEQCKWYQNIPNHHRQLGLVRPLRVPVEVFAELPGLGPSDFHIALA